MIRPGEILFICILLSILHQYLTRELFSYLYLYYLYCMMIHPGDFYLSVLHQYFPRRDIYLRVFVLSVLYHDSPKRVFIYLYFITCIASRFSRRAIYLHVVLFSVLHLDSPEELFIYLYFYFLYCIKIREKTCLFTCNFILRIASRCERRDIYLLVFLLSVLLHDSPIIVFLFTWVVILTTYPMHIFNQCEVLHPLLNLSSPTIEFRPCHFFIHPQKRRDILPRFSN